MKTTIAKEFLFIDANVADKLIALQFSGHIFNGSKKGVP